MIDFSNYTKANIESRMLAQVDPNIDTREGSMVQTPVGAGAYEFEGLYLDLAKVQENSNVQTAVGYDLDLDVLLRGLTRIPATATVRQGTFLDDNGDPMTIPTGSRFKTINGEDSVVFVSGDLISAGVYKLTCETAGIIGNSYSGPILPITAINNLASATIGTIITVGAEEETDSALRARFNLSLSVQPGQGNRASYQQRILQIPGVGALQMYCQIFDNNSVYIVLLDDTYQPATQDLLDEAKAIIDPVSGQGVGFAPFGSSVFFYSPSTQDIDVAATITWETGRGGPDDVQAVTDAIDAYIKGVVVDEWGEYTVSGGTVYYNLSIYLARMTAKILEVDGVVNVTGLTLNGSATDYTQSVSQRANAVLPVLGTVTLS